MDEVSKITLTATNKREWPDSTLKSLNKFRQSEHSLCDVFLQGEDEMEPIPANRNVLAANSIYFHTMFTSGLKESKQDHRKISILGVGTEALSFIVEFLYEGSCNLPSGTMHRVMDLLAASTMLQVDELSHACSIYLEQCFDSESALELWLFAENYGVSYLAEPFKKYVQSYFWSISRSQRVLELELQDMAALLGLEEVNLGNAANEDTLVELLLRWLTYNPKALDSDLLPVLSKICWSEASQECKDKFRETLAKISMDSSLESFQGEEVFDTISKSSSLDQRFNRTFFCSVCAIGGLQNSRIKEGPLQPTSMEVADIDTRTGKVLRQFSKPRGFHERKPICNYFYQHYNFLPFRGHLYASWSCNLHVDGTPLIDVLCLSMADLMNANLKELKTRNWDTKSVWWKLQEKQRTYADAIDEKRGMVYLCGYTRRGSGPNPKKVTKLDIENNVCSQLTSLPFGRSHHRAIVVEGDLFVLGGVDRSPTPISTVLKYDWTNNVWEEVSPMHEPRVDGAYACVDGRIYASGGSTSEVPLRSVEVYNPSLDIWTTLSPMLVPRVNHRLVAVGKYLFAMGGESYSEEKGDARNVQRIMERYMNTKGRVFSFEQENDDDVNIRRTVERYSITEGCWETSWEMAECRSGRISFSAFTL